MGNNEIGLLLAGSSEFPSLGTSITSAIFFVEGVVEGAQPPKIFCQCHFLRHSFATLFFPRARAQLIRYPRVLNAGGPVRLCFSTWLVVVGGDEAWYGSRPHLKRMAVIMRQSSAGDFLSFCLIAAVLG